jgi:LysR family transcriptional regulator, hydrogen peroxide-inducible genes activator
VASGVGITVLPTMATPKADRDDLMRYLGFDGLAPSRRVVMVWRKTFTRGAAIECLRQAVLDTVGAQVSLVTDAKAQYHPH